MDWLTTRPTPDVANHWLALLSMALFAIGVIAAGMLSTRPGLPPFNGNFTNKFVSLATALVGWISGVGLFFHIMRLLQIDPGTLGRPIWIVLTWVAMAIALGWLIYKTPADRKSRQASRERNVSRKAHTKSA